jgi:hypothetical protein
MAERLSLEAFLRHERLTPWDDDPDGGEQRSYRAARRIGAVVGRGLYEVELSETEYLGYVPGDQ